MTNPRLKHQMLRLDLLQSHVINQYPNKLFYKYTNIEDLPERFSFKEFSNKSVIEKDLDSNVLWFERSFFDQIKLIYRMHCLAHDDDFVKNDLETNFFNINENIGNQEFNPSVFGNGMQIKIADEYARLFWESIME